MITPRFNLTQEENSVSIFIRAPYCNLADLDVDIDGNTFLFVCQPYYLRLNLPGDLLENGKSKSSYDSESGEFVFTYGKKNSGEHFADLELITKLLCPKVDVVEGGRTIEVLTGDSEVEVQDTQEYGFAMRGSRYFKQISFEFQDILEVNPAEVKLEDRRGLRLQKEAEQFSADHYLADFIENEEIMTIIKSESPWKDLNKDEIKFTTSERDFLKDLPNVSYSLSEKQSQVCNNSLLEILFAYCYDQRSTVFESNCESGWAISKISASLCWCDGFATPKEAILCAHRRSLIYPLYRNFNLCECIFRDLKTVLELGEVFIIKCLIEIYNIFLNDGAARYIFNNLFIKDYIVYVMKWDKSQWAKLTNEIKTMSIQRAELGLNLEQIEKSLTCDDLASRLSNLELAEQDSDDSSTSSDDSSEETESSDSSTSGDSYTLSPNGSSKE